ncbi:MAG TPA: hypothetical protein VF861_00665 [Telluria sp.]
MKNRTCFLIMGSALVLSACGGGGSGATESAPGPVSTLSTVTAGNANKVASNAYAASSVISDSSSSLTDVLTGVSIGGASISTVSPVLKLVKHARGAPQLLTGVTISESCSGGGTVTIDATIRNQQTISDGDTMTVTANNCVEDGSTMNGAMAITFSGMSGDILNTWTFGATMDTRFTNFSVASGSETLAVNGDMKIAINQTNSTTSSLTISGKSLQTTEQKAGTTIATRTLTDYSLTGSTLGTTITSAANFTLSGNTSTLGQFSYSVKNIQPFVSTGSAMPSSGSLIVNGAASSVTVTVAGPSGVRLDYSAKGDGVITQTTTQSWTEFLASF